MKRERGITLLEGLFSLLLVMLVLGALTRTLVNTGQVRSNRDNMDRAVDEMHVLYGIRGDIANCLQILAPLDGQTTNILRLQQVDPELSFGQRIDSSSGPALPFELAEQVRVEYRIADERLLREVTPTAGGTPTALRLLPATAFEVQREGMLLTVRLEFPYSRLRKARVLKVELR
jgi:type II secretory pathway pseudopilin PulG